MLLTLAMAATCTTTARAQSEDASTDIGTTQLVQSQTLGALRLGNVTLMASTMQVKDCLLAPPRLHLDYMWFLLQLPVTYDTNAGFAAQNPISSSRIDPKLQFNFSNLFDGKVQFSNVTAYDVDRYGSDNQTSAETLQSIFQLNYFSRTIEEPRDTFELVVPYLWYQPTIKFDHTFTHSTVTQNDVGGGISYKKKLGSWTASIDLNFTHRFTAPADSTSLWIKTSIGQKFANNITLLLTPNFRFRWYDATSGVSRRDETLQIPLVVEWDPDSLYSLPWIGDVQVSLFFQKNFSNGPAFANQQLNSGGVPELSYVLYDRPS